MRIWGFGRYKTRFQVVQLHALLPLGLVLPWGHLSQCRQEGPGPQGAQEALEAQPLLLALGLPERDGTWHDSEGERKGFQPPGRGPLRWAAQCLLLPQQAQGKRLCYWSSCHFLVAIRRDGSLYLGIRGQQALLHSRKCAISPPAVCR